ncbi:MAG: hypothetical protein KKF44_03465 [Nanoarchaeota archaeon]|nr:hypothetical protein [Nanoarchaeota archaeon]
MNAKILFLGLTALFLILSFSSVLSFTTLEKAKWFDNGIDIAVGIVLMYLGSVLFLTYKQTKNKSIIYSAMGIFLMAFQKVVEIFLQEWQISIGYQYPAGVLGLNLGTLGWGISDSIFVCGLLFILFGLRETLK